MNERFSGDLEPQRFKTIQTRGWSDPSRRDAFEKRFLSSVGRYGFEFGGDQYAEIRAVDTIGDGVVAELNEQFSDQTFRSIRVDRFDNPNGTFSGGVILFGAASRERAEDYQPYFADRINAVLEALDANVRLGQYVE